jgi:hypothetical protein
MLIPVMSSIGVVDNAFKIYLEPAKTTVDPPVIGETIDLDVMIQGLDPDEKVYNLSFAIDYDEDVIDIVDPRFIGDIQDHFADFNTLNHTDVMSVEQNTTKTLDPPPDNPELDGRNVERYILGINIKKEENIELEMPFESDSSATSLMTITFTIKSEDRNLWTPLIFVSEEKTEASDRDDNLFDLEISNGEVNLPVPLSALGAIGHPSGNKIFWEAESQQGNLGWNIYRTETKDGEPVKINGELIKGAGTTSNPMKYSFIDKDVEKGKGYYYYLEDISFSGEKHRTPLIKTNLINKATSWGNIKLSVSR